MWKAASAGAVLAAAVLFGASGCTSGAPRVSPAELERTANGIADEAIALLDGADEVEVVTDDSRQCSGTDVDPDGSIRQWYVARDVRLPADADASETVAGLLDELEAVGWERGEPSAVGRNGIRHRLTDPERAGFALALTEPVGIAPVVVLVRVTSPCGEFPEG